MLNGFPATLEDLCSDTNVWHGVYMHAEYSVSEVRPSMIGSWSNGWRQPHHCLLPVTDLSRHHQKNVADMFLGASTDQGSTIETQQRLRVPGAKSRTRNAPSARRRACRSPICRSEPVGLNQTVYPMRWLLSLEYCLVSVDVGASL